MKPLYESLLDTIDARKQKTVEHIKFDDALEFLKGYNSMNDCKTRVEGDCLIVYSTRSSFQEFRFYYMELEGKVYIVNKKLQSKVTPEAFEYVRFEKCHINIFIQSPLQIAPEIVKNCNNCIIGFLSWDNSYDRLAKLLKETKGNTVMLDSSKKLDSIDKYVYSYSELSKTDFSNCDVILWRGAMLSGIKNLKAKSLLCQSSNMYQNLEKKYVGLIPHPSTEDEPEMWRFIEEFLDKNPDIKSFGMIDYFVQYHDWVVKVGGQYQFKVVKAGLKRIPKIK